MMEKLDDKPPYRQPPRWATWLLERFCAPALLEEMRGDLEELYRERVAALGQKQADHRYVRDVLSLVRPFVLKRKPQVYTSPSFPNAAMFHNYLTVALRNITRHKAFSAINLLGLVLGLTCSLLILLWVQDERRVDDFHANGNHLFQVYEREQYDGRIGASYHTQGLLAQELKRAFPEIRHAVSFEQMAVFGGKTFEAGGKVGKMAGTYTGPDFFSMFSFPLLVGSAQTALTDPGSIAISRKLAEQFFGSPEKAIGKNIRFENKEDLSVTAVFENVPAHSSLQFDFLRSWEDYAKENAWVSGWGSASPYTFVQLRPGADPVKVESKIKDFIYRYKAKENGSLVELGLQAFSDRYLHSTFENGQVSGGRIGYVRLFSLVAAFILLIACINFMNLATARSTQRAKEVGIRKVVGAVRSVLITQFVGEAILLTCCAGVITVALVAVVLPVFNDFTGKQIALPIGQPFFWAAFAGLLLMTGLVAGSYPALFLSSLEPVRVLNNRLRLGPGTTIFRKALVVFQFALSVMLIVGTVVMYRQMEYIQGKNLGYDRENLIYIPIEGALVKKYNLFKEESGKLPGVLSISRMRLSPTDIDHGTSDISWAGKDPNSVVMFTDELVGYDFTKTLGLKLREGRDFSKDFVTDSVNYILNESAVKKIGYRDPIGKPFWWGGQQGTIVGVLQDFHFRSMHDAIGPLVIRLNEKKPYGTILVRTQAGKTREALAGLEKVNKALNPGFPFTYQFSDQEYGKLYRSEQLVNQLSTGFAVLAITISCLGLLGLAMFMAEQRVREIGIRKVLGASVGSLLVLLSRDFLRLVLLAIVVALPLAWYAMQGWLGSFAYKIDLEWWMFAGAGGLAVGIALLTISVQSIKAALTNPVKSLRSE